VLIADFAQTLEVTLWRNQHASGTGHWLDEYRRDVRRVMQFDQLQQLIGQAIPPCSGMPREKALLASNVCGR
jgi:hypothetical protein